MVCCNLSNSVVSFSTSTASTHYAHIPIEDTQGNMSRSEAYIPIEDTDGIKENPLSTVYLRNLITCKYMIAIVPATYEMFTIKSRKIHRTAKSIMITISANSNDWQMV